MKENKIKVKCLVIYTTDCDGIISRIEDNGSIKKLSVYSHNPIRFETNRARKEFEKKEAELEASIRKEVVMDIIKLAVNTPEKVNELNIALDSRSRQELYLKAVGYWDCIKAIKEYALSKGITLSKDTDVPTCACGGCENWGCENLKD